MREGKNSNLGVEFQEHYRVGESSHYQLPGGHLVPNSRHLRATVRVALDEFKAAPTAARKPDPRPGRRLWYQRAA